MQKHGRRWQTLVDVVGAVVAGLLFAAPFVVETIRGFI